MSNEKGENRFLGRAFDAVLIAIAALILPTAWGSVLSFSKPALEWFHSADPLEIAAAVSVPPAILVLVLYLVLRSRYSHRLHYPYRPKRFFRIKEQRITFEVKDHVIEYTKEKDLQSLHDDVQFYDDMYRWTGDAKATPHCVVPSHTVVLDDRVSIWQMYRIKFNRHLNRGDSEKTSLRWTIPVTDLSVAVPFISSTVEEPTDRLKFRFSPKPNSVSKVYFETKFSISAKRPFETEELVANSDGVFTKELVPKLYYYYELRWLPAVSPAEA